MSAATSMSLMGSSKEFILKKYFDELQKFWATQQRLDTGESTSSSSSSGASTFKSILQRSMKSIKWSQLCLQSCGKLFVKPLLSRIVMGKEVELIWSRGFATQNCKKNQQNICKYSFFPWLQSCKSPQNRLQCLQ